MATASPGIGRSAKPPTAEPTVFPHGHDRDWTNDQVDWTIDQTALSGRRLSLPHCMPPLLWMRHTLIHERTMMKAPLTTAAWLLIGSLQLAAAGPTHTEGVISSGDSVQWGAPPPVFPAGAKFAVLDGDPAAEGLLTVRLVLPPGYTIAPHWHPTDEHVTVLKGTLLMGMGDKLDKSHPLTLTAGGYAVARAQMHHFAWTQTGATIQVHMKGPFALTYVNPEDDPSKAAH